MTDEQQRRVWKEGDRRIYAVLDTLIARLEQEARVARSGVIKATEEYVHGQDIAFSKAIMILTIARNAHAVVD